MNIIQPKSKDHFSFDNYVNKEGFISYFWQVKETLGFNPENCLVIGQGDNIVPYILQSQGLEVDTFDILADLKPTYIGDLLDIDKIINRQYDVVLCCEVLEHLPFVYFDRCLKKLNKIASKGIVLSLPVYGLSGYIKIWAPKYFNLNIPIRTNFYKPGHFVMSRDHHWEINSRGYHLKKIRRVILDNYIISREYRVDENPYHRFFILNKKD